MTYNDGSPYVSLDKWDDPGKIEETASSKISASAVKELEQLLADLEFWQMKTLSTDGGFDGSQWMLEVVKERKYKIVDRWSPEDGDPMRKIGEWFLDKANWTPKKLY